MPPSSRPSRSAPRSSIVSGSRSQVQITCRPCRLRASNVCWSSTAVARLPAKNWTSSTSRMSSPRYERRKPGRPLPCSACRKVVVNCSAGTSIAEIPGCCLRTSATIPSRRCVLPVPLGPWITRGEISPSRDTTISAAARAMRLLPPVTKSSSRASGRRRADSAKGRGGCDVSGNGCGDGSTNGMGTTARSASHSGGATVGGSSACWSGATCSSVGSASRKSTACTPPTTSAATASMSPRKLRRTRSWANWPSLITVTASDSMANRQIPSNQTAYRCGPMRSRRLAWSRLTTSDACGSPITDTPERRRGRAGCCEGWPAC